MRRWWRGAVGGLVLAAAMVGPPGGSDSAEAITRVRARVTWSTVVPYLPTFRGYERFIEENPLQVGKALTFFRVNTLTRRSNPDPQREQVLPGVTFADDVKFMLTTDVPDAVIHVHQPPLGPLKNECHVLVTAVQDKFGVRAGPVIPAPGLGEVSLGSLSSASAPYTVSLSTKVPTGAALVRPVPKVLTSVVRLLEKVPVRSTAVLPPRDPRHCGGQIGGRGYNSLNQTLVIRTELQLNRWASANGRPTPTAVSRSG